MKRHSIVTTGVLAWLAGIVVVYFAFHKPFAPTLALGLSRAIWQMLVPLAIVSAGGGIGTRLLPDVAKNWLTRMAMQAGIGLGLMSLGMLVIGSTLGLNPFLLGGTLALLLLVFRAAVAAWWKNWQGLVELWNQGGKYGRGLGLLCGLILAATLTMALAPPLKFDALVYHLALPDAYLRAGRIVYVADNIFWGMPQVAEMLYTLSMALWGGWEAATVLGWLAGAIALLGIAGYVAEFTEARYGWVAVGVLSSGYSLAAALAWGYVEWFTILFGIGFLAALERTGSDEDNKFQWLAGIFAGLAVGAKYTAGVLLIAGTGVFLWSPGARNEKLKAILRFGLGAGAVFVPWMIKNAWATGNPVYPFFYPSGEMDSLRLTLIQGRAAWGSWLDAILLPIRATVLGHEGGPGYSASIGPLFIALGALAWMDWKARTVREKTVLRTAGMVAVIGLLVWMAAGRLSLYLIQTHLYLAIFPAFAILAMMGFSYLDQQKLGVVRMGRVAGGLVVLVLGLNALQTIEQTVKAGSLPAILRIRSADEYVMDNLGWYGAAVREVRELPEGSKALMLWETRSLYCAPVCTPDEVIDRWAHDRRTFETPEAIVQSWKNEAYTHVLYYQAGADFVRREDRRYQEQDWQVLEEVLSRLDVITNFGGAYIFFALNP